MEKNGNVGNTALGNTSNQSGRVVPSKLWCFTAYNTSVEEMKELIGNFGNYLFGEEICPTTGKNHLQGFIEFSVKTRPLEKIKNKNIHWEKIKGSKEDNIKYCSKEGKVHTNNLVWKPIKILDENKLFYWQKDILKEIKNEPDDRKINWYWEPDGNLGKTTFCKFLSAKYGAIPLEGKKNDILYCAAEFASNIYVWDMERSMEEYISYGAIEKIKNGYYMCAKYESKPIIRNSPHIFIFANFPPDTTKLSQDRWNIVRIQKQSILNYTTDITSN